MTQPYLVLVAELASRYGVLLDLVLMRDGEAGNHVEESQFAATLAHRQAEALRVRDARTCFGSERHISHLTPL